MEPEHHPFGKENDLNQTSMIMFHVNLQGCKGTNLVRSYYCGQLGTGSKPAVVGQVPHFELQGKVLGLIGGSGGIGSKASWRKWLGSTTHEHHP